MKKIILVLSTLLVIGCATTAKYEASLKTWVGQSESRLVQTWGPPADTYEPKDGTKILTYRFDGGQRTTANYNQFTRTVNANSYSYWCKTSFYIDNFGVVSNWRWEGNSCKAK